MKTIKILRKSQLSESHANSFANGRARTIYVNLFVMCAAMLFLTSCSGGHASINEFICQANMEGINAVLIDEDVPLGNRQATYTNGSEKAVEIIRKKCNVRNIIHTSFAYLGS